MSDDNSYQLWRDPAVVASFQSADVPYDRQQTEVFLRLLPFDRQRDLRILDVGCGSAPLLATLLNVFPAATGIGVDVSPPMLQLAQDRLAPFGERARAVHADFNGADWTRGIAGPFDVIVSRYAIHHVPDPAKRAIDDACFRLLRRPGLFVNIEHVASASKYVESLFDRLFVDTLHDAARHQGDTASYAEIEDRFHQRPDKAANILAPVEAQLAWLRDAGFTDVDCYWKCFELAIFGGYKW